LKGLDSGSLDLGSLGLHLVARHCWRLTGVNILCLGGSYRLSASLSLSVSSIQRFFCPFWSCKKKLQDVFLFRSFRRPGRRLSFLSDLFLFDIFSFSKIRHDILGQQGHTRNLLLLLLGRQGLFCSFLPHESVCVWDVWDEAEKERRMAATLMGK